MPGPLTHCSPVIRWLRSVVIAAAAAAMTSSRPPAAGRRRRAESRHASGVGVIGPVYRSRRVNFKFFPFFDLTLRSNGKITVTIVFYVTNRP